MSRDAEIRAVVLLSGGLDSATVLAKARADGRICYALSVDYGQRHRAELAAAARLAVQLGALEIAQLAGVAEHPGGVGVRGHHLMVGGEGRGPPARADR